VWPPVSAGCL